MKKLLLSALALVGFASFTIAQTAPAKTATPAAKSKMTVVKKDAPPKTAKVVPMPAKPAATAKPATAAKPAAAGPVKKDGTPDKRFKANKTPEGPLKKDGTPDKRFKANKKG